MENQNAGVEKTCGYCSGMGDPSGDFVSSGVMCPVCNGSGKVNVPADAVEHEECHGRGKIKIRGPMGKQFIDCEGCHGTGWISHSQL